MRNASILSCSFSSPCSSHSRSLSSPSASCSSFHPPPPPLFILFFLFQPLLSSHCAQKKIVKNTQSRWCPCSHSHRLSCSCTQAHAQTRKCTNTRNHANRRAHVHAHTRACIYAIRPIQRATIRSTIQPTSFPAGALHLHSCSHTPLLSSIRSVSHVSARART